MNALTTMTRERGQTIVWILLKKQCRYFLVRRAGAGAAKRLRRRSERSSNCH